MTTLTFSGYSWDVRAQVSGLQEAPGQNWWSDTSAFASVAADDMSLTVRQDAAASNRWSSVQVDNTASLGYGTYEWAVSNTTNLGTLHHNLALSFYVYSTSPDFAHREIAMHFSKWGVSSATNNGRFELGRAPGNLQTNFVQPSGLSARVRFRWSPGRIEWAAYTSAGTVISRYVYVGSDVPPTGGERAGMRFWTPGGTGAPPASATTVVIESFSHTPLGEESGVVNLRNVGSTSQEIDQVIVGQDSFIINHRLRSSRGRIPMVYSHDATTVAQTMPTFRNLQYFEELRAVTTAGIPVIVPFLGTGKNYGNDASIAAIDTNLTFYGTEYVNSVFSIETREDSVCLWGDGMGALAVLNWAWRNRDRVAAIVLRNPIVNLTDYFSRNASLQADMNTAYGGSSQFTAALPTHDPSLNTSLLRDIGGKIKIWYGSEDTEVPPEIILAFASAIGCSVRKVDGAVHTDMFNTSNDETTSWLTAAMKVQRTKASYSIPWTDENTWDNLTQALITAPESGIPDNYTLTVTGNRGRVVNPVGGSNGTNDRRWFYNPSFVAVNSEIHNRMHSWNGILAGQQGNGHRIIQRPDGTGEAFVVWQNVFFASPWLMNFGVWRWNGLNSGLATNQTLGTFAPAVKAHTGGNITSAVRASNVVTYTCSVFNTTPVVGDSVSVSIPGATSFDVTGTVTDVTGLTFKVAQNGANASTTEDGAFYNHTRGLFLPLHLRTRLIDKTVYWKNWYEGVPEPDWGDPDWGGEHTYPYTEPVGAGRSGFLIGHIQGPPRYVEQGVFETWEL